MKTTYAHTSLHVWGQSEDWPLVCWDGADGVPAPMLYTSRNQIKIPDSLLPRPFLAVAASIGKRSAAVEYAGRRSGSGLLRTEAQPIAVVIGNASSRAGTTGA